ncbi:Lacal_2735 family protein [Gramella sp. AN32]|uniref:Lacal_2735 family protein n=1 Tax=Christiangramia antarctica TaxID=2058158 RepID=A0ABW5X571_9FLAO|nr:Lacal_2735 family protein [Gramella sp. AN32]MCM4158041.1 hypothetical protein [Gramella sp. AN32]
MFRIFENKSREELLCEKYSRLMFRSYKAALLNKEESEKLHERACKIKQELQRMQCSLMDI